MKPYLIDSNQLHACPFEQCQRYEPSPQFKCNRMIAESPRGINTLSANVLVTYRCFDAPRVTCCIGDIGGQTDPRSEVDVPCRKRARESCLLCPYHTQLARASRDVHPMIAEFGEPKVDDVVSPCMTWNGDKMKVRCCSRD